LAAFAAAASDTFETPRRQRIDDAASVLFALPNAGSAVLRQPTGLAQFSGKPIQRHLSKKEMVGDAGLEPATR
jgi:hypothetical protein